jgi:Ca2+-binding EF-hand superfamily protein
LEEKDFSRIFTVLDKDNDGHIHKQEFVAQKKPEISKADELKIFY